MNMDVLQEELKKRNLTLDHIMEYIKFEDECIEKGFTFNSLIEAREKQIPKKYISIDSPYMGQCPVCCSTVWMNSGYCWKCGQAIDWGEEK